MCGCEWVSTTVESAWESYHVVAMNLKWYIHGITL